MGLKDLKIPTVKIEVSDTEDFIVRGLSVRDIGLLADRHHAMLTALFGEIATANGTAGIDEDTVSTMLPQLLNRAPDLVADIIAVASGDIGDSPYVSVLALPIQVEALNNVFRLTFKNDGDLGKVIETVIQGLKGTTRQLNSLNGG